jgi:hypothetical protein
MTYNWSIGRYYEVQTVQEFDKTMAINVNSHHHWYVGKLYPCHHFRL